MSRLAGLTAAPNAYASRGQLAVILVRVQQLGANAAPPSVPVPAAAAALEGTISAGWDEAPGVNAGRGRQRYGFRATRWRVTNPPPRSASV